MKLSSLLQYSAMYIQDRAENPEWQKLYPIPVEFLPVAPGLLGVEIEAENFSTARFQSSPLYDHAARFWEVGLDNSLRNNGVELRSFPATGANLGMALDFLHRINRLMLPDYNDRTGIHVHMNVRDLSVHQWRQFAALYTLYEPALFRFSGNRQHNIFCVPVRTGTHDFPRIFACQENQFMGNIVHGNKYLALNYLPTAKTQFGTVEFRHMAGTNNVQTIAQWVNLILRMRESAILNRRLLDRILELTEATHEEFITGVFKEQRPLINPTWAETQEGICLLKQWSINQDEYSHWIEDTKEPKTRKKPIVRWDVLAQPRVDEVMEARIAEFHERPRRIPLERPEQRGQIHPVAEGARNFVVQGNNAGRQWHQEYLDPPPAPPDAVYRFNAQQYRVNDRGDIEVVPEPPPHPDPLNVIFDEFPPEDQR